MEKIHTLFRSKIDDRNKAKWKIGNYYLTKTNADCWN